MRVAGGADWRAKAERIRKEIRERLWVPDTGWFRCLHPEGPDEIVYSIQAFDALRAGCCNSEMEAALISRLNENEFLGKYGISSVSRKDRLHYEMNDPDWSGGGAYTGELPQLVTMLYEYGYAELAWDIFQRDFWMGRHLPYYPQEHYADRPGVPQNKRPNIISGVAAVETVVTGLFGLRPEIDGSLHVKPCPPDGGKYNLTGLRWRKHIIDIQIEGGSFRLNIDGEHTVTGKAGEAYRTSLGG